jgi:hypothetical protein
MWQEEGFLKGETNIGDVIYRLTSYVNTIPVQFRNFSQEKLLYKPTPGKWSKQEILGHLIDSAINNLKRFTEIQFLPQPYTVVSYQQDNLVLVNNYQHLPLEHLLNLWQAINRQIIFIVKNIPPEKLNDIVDPQYDNHELKTLGWVIGDYMAHMEYHFRQIFGENEN